MRPTRRRPPAGREPRRRNRRRGRSAEQNSRGTSWPAIISRNVARSISARCRTSPSSDIVDGSTERRAMASASRPAHFISSVRRCAAQGFDQRGALVAQPRSVLTRVVVGRLAVRGEHVGASGRGHGRDHRKRACRPARDYSTGVTSTIGSRQWRGGVGLVALGRGVQHELGAADDAAVAVVDVFELGLARIGRRIALGEVGDRCAPPIR